MWNEPTKERMATIPKLYETEEIPPQAKDIHLKFFIGSCTWYIAEYDGQDTFFGFCHLGNDLFAEWGLVSFQELKDIKIEGWLEVDCELEDHFQIKKSSEIELINNCMQFENQ